MDDKLCAAQQQALDTLLRLLPIGSVFVLYGGSGSGKTTVLRKLHQAKHSAFLNMEYFVDAMRGHHPLAMEETFEHMMIEALKAHDTVIVDDFDLLNHVACGSHMYPRLGFLNAPLLTICTYAEEAGKKLIFACHRQAPEPVRERAFRLGIPEFAAADYEALGQRYLNPAAAPKLDYKKIHRFAQKPNGHQLRAAYVWFRFDSTVDIDRFIDYLRSHHLASDVHLGEVQAVDLRDLKGVDDIIQSLEANIIVPLENDELATTLNLKPKRGVLLTRPPARVKQRLDGHWLTDCAVSFS
jgi:transitional endoplasmic reticulum ATPase